MASTISELLLCVMISASSGSMAASERDFAAAVAEAGYRDEGSPLLAGRRSSSLQLEMPTAGPGPGSELANPSKAFRVEVFRIIRLAGPLSMQDILILIQASVTVAFVGRIDAISLSAMILCTTTYNITGLSLVMGVASGAETLSGQVFGAKNYGAVGVILQKSLCITWLACCGVVALWTQAHTILLATGQDPVIAAMASEQLWLCVPALLATATTECLKRYLMAQGIVVPTCLVYIVCTCLSPLVNWVIIFGMGWGLRGAAIALDIVSCMNAVALLLYVWYHTRKLDGSGRETWLGWSWECFSRWQEYFALAIPSTIMACLEWWLFEVLILLTGQLKEADINLGVMGIVFQIGGLCYMIPVGLQGAASTRTSNELGDGNPGAAKLAARAAMFVGLCTQVAIALAIYFGRSIWGYALSNDAEVVRRVALILPIIALMVPCDGINAVCSGVVRGCGRQLVAAAMNIVTFWCIGFPLAVYLGFRTSLGIYGLWFGVCIVTYIQLAAITTLVGCLNWEKEAERAAALVSRNTPEQILAKTPVDDLQL